MVAKETPLGFEIKGVDNFDRLRRLAWNFRGETLSGVPARYVDDVPYLTVYVAGRSSKAQRSELITYLHGAADAIGSRLIPLA